MSNRTDRRFVKRHVEIEDIGFEPLGHVLFRVLHDVRAKRAGLANREREIASPVFLHKIGGQTQKTE